MCGFGGILSCGLTHTGIVPLDLVKCRIQVDPAKYQSLGKAFRITIAEEGVRGLAKGWAPTLIGYSMQGLCKFGFYEVFKIFYSNIIGEVPIVNFLKSQSCSLKLTIFIKQPSFYIGIQLLLENLLIPGFLSKC